jgi:hypothetical protein
MMTAEQFREMALSFPESVEGSHFDTTDFRVSGKIFATLRSKDGRAVVKLTPDEQRLFMETSPEMLQPVKGSWGVKGWTQILLDMAEQDAARHVMATAWKSVAPTKVVKRHAL